MNYNFWLEGKNIDLAKAEADGFQKEGNALCRRVDMLNGAYIIIKISQKNGEPQLCVDVFDGMLNKKDNRFYNGHGGAAFKAEVREKVLAALQNCLS